MKRLLELKTLITLLLVVAMSSVFIACGDDDEPTTTNRELLIGKKWESVKSVTNGKEEVAEFYCAEKHDYTLFKADGKVLDMYYNSDCEENRDEDYKWELSGNTLIRINEEKNNKEITIKKDYYFIKRLTSTELVLEFFKRTEEGKEVLIDENKDGKQDKMTLYFKSIE